MNTTPFPAGSAAFAAPSLPPSRPAPRDSPLPRAPDRAAGGPPLRVAIVTDRPRAPRYVADVLRGMLASPGIDLVGIATVARNPAPGPSLGLFLGLDGIEGLASRCRGRPMTDFDPVDLASALPAKRLAPVDLALAEGTLVPMPTALVQLLDHDLDVLICCTQTPLSVPRSIVRHGVLGIELGPGVPVHAAWAGAAELAMGSPVMLVRLVDYAAESEVLYAATATLIGTSLRHNRRQAMAKGGAALQRLLQSLGRTGAGRRHLPRLLEQPAAPPATPRPSAGLFAGACRRMGRQLLKNRLDPKVDYNRWHLAYCFSDRALPEIEFDRLRYLAPAPGTFWADPFPLVHRGRHYILFEELPYASERGRLLAVEVFEDAPAGPPMTVLERDYHLSYPQVFHWQDELYMVPETKQASRVELLRCIDFPSRWELHQVLLEDVRAVDATLCRRDRRWWMFVNLALDGLEAADELHLYHADSLFGEWRPHPANPLCADVRCARPAGPLFETEGELFRPSQDCAGTYGGALWINRVERLDRDGYAERPVKYIAPDWHPDVSTVHTLGRAGRLTVLDCVVDDRGGLDIQHACP